jgi:glycosyltransferase involved in cell wall biosynthesis
MTIIFESQIYPDSLVATYAAKSKVILDYAAHNLCKAIYTGLKENGATVRLVNVPNIGSYPFLYKSPRVAGAQMEGGISLPFWNISLLKRHDIRRRIGNAIRKELNRQPDGERSVLVLYNYRSLPLLPALKHQYPDLKVILLITDLLEFMLRPTGTLFKVAGGKYSGNTLHKAEYFNYVDGYVLLAPAMRERLPVGEKPWIQVEGIYNSDTPIDEQPKEGYKTILYTGNLGLRYGIGTLLEAFHKIPSSDYRLWICGGGDGLAEVQRYGAMDNRIIYKGILPRKDVLQLQAQATVLVNPRNSEDEYTRYSFPSKTMEYLASGTPVVMSHLQSIPHEYDDHIYYIDNETTEGMRDKLIEVCAKSAVELSIFGKEASSFIYKWKTPAAQTAKILNLINKLY